MGRALNDEARMCGEHIKIVKGVMTCTDFDSPEYVEWVFDTLLDHCRMDEDNEQVIEIGNILSSIKAEEKLADERKRSIAFQIVNGRKR